MKAYLKRIIISALVIASISLNAAEKKIKVISLSPNLTEIICQLGKEQCLVGRSSACNYPETVQKIPAVGGYGVPVIEKIILLKPDYVVTSTLKDMSVKNVLEENNITCLLLPAVKFNDYYDAVDKLGHVLQCPGKAAAEVKRVKTELEQLGDLCKKSQTKPKVFLMIWDNPLMTVGNDSFINDLIAFAGGHNIGNIEKQGYYRCGNEWVITSQPDVIICPSMNKSKVGEIKSRDGWQTIPAIKNNRIFTELNADTIFRLGPRSIDGIKAINQCLFKTSSQKND
jgi:iron complex transport system substrate-binding protein